MYTLSITMIGNFYMFSKDCDINQFKQKKSLKKIVSLQMKNKIFNLIK